MTSYPAGVDTITVVTSGYLDMFGQEATLQVKVRPLFGGASRLRWDDTGDVVTTAPRTFTAKGEPVQFTVPVTDQEGWKDGTGEDYQGWAYEARSVVYGSDGTERAAWRQVFQPVTADGETFDLDTIPDAAPGVEALVVNVPGPPGPVGPRGFPGIDGTDGTNGAQGLPGVNAVPADAAVAGYIGTGGASATQTAGDARWSRLAASNTFVGQQDFKRTGAEAPAIRAGTGAARGAPTGVITAVTNGAGAITGTRKYAYTELDGHGGETPRSPASAGLVLAGQRAKLTVPPIRPGMTDRVIYASDDNGVTWHQLGLFNVSGHLWFASKYLDNTAVLAGAAPPAVDTSKHWQMSVGNDGMTYFRRTDAVSDVSDVTFLTGNPANSGSLAIDAYGQILARAGGPAAVPAVTAQVAQSTAGGGSAFQAQYVPDDGVGNAVQTFRVTEFGTVEIVGAGLDLAGPFLTIDPGGAAQVFGTGGLCRVVVPGGSSNHGLVVKNQGTGDTIRNETATFRVLPDGSINAIGSAGTHYLNDIRAGTRLVVGSGVGGLWGSGNLIVAETAGAPGVPVAGGVIYVEGGALKYRGTAGTVTVVAPA